MADLTNLQAALAQLGSNEQAAFADVNTGIASLQAQIAALSAGSITQDQIDALTATAQGIDAGIQQIDAAAKAVVTPAP